ncbi:hypothetical protein V1J52_24315 [Streptomyces sp. TRM 70351]|uniref:hypothetical protein n=1 Tax=Streptomyces sp. TRM 70351 TaxID=3116552 RepID=UPI002E7B5B66|nr:hypothetical protein [Streptomyces sp. TRM 70351]MEE1931262.1 hypothetical protein [Streptomyces sp. TRM 70351]
MKLAAAPTLPTLLATAFYAFHDLHRPAYHAYAAALLAPEEAATAVAELFDLVADQWTTVVTGISPSAWAWTRHVHAVAHRTGHPTTPAEDAVLLHHTLHLSIDKIATITGTEPATVTALLATRHHEHPSDPTPTSHTPRRLACDGPMRR